MDPLELGTKYDRIAHWWQQHHQHSEYGLHALERALQWLPHTGQALDVGCGAGGRLVHRLVQHGLTVTGLDVSHTMVELARQNHPEQHFLHQDICQWESQDAFDLILAWDSLFHLPLSQHEAVLNKLCRHLKPEGILLYTLGNAAGEHTDTWRNDTFYYSSIGINANVQCLIKAGLTLLHLELDQYPEKHVYLIATRPAGDVIALG